jgi:hypothetical protein
MRKGNKQRETLKEREREIKKSENKERDTKGERKKNGYMEREKEKTQRD